MKSHTDIEVNTIVIKIVIIIDIKNDGTFRLDQKYFNYATGLTMTNNKFHNLFGQPPRKPDKDKLTQFHMDLAASIQLVTEEIVIKIDSRYYRPTEVETLLGDPSKAMQDLSWQPRISLEEMISDMVNADKKLASLDKQHLN